MPAIVELTAEHLDAAAGLLAARQRMLRAARPELPAAFEEPSAHRAGLTELLAAEGAHGVLALDGTRPVAFLLGEHRSAEIWGRAAWSPVNGSAADPDLGAAGGEALRDCYAAWSTHFVDLGIFRHYVHAPVDDRVAEAAWFNTGFGRMQAHAVRSTAGEESPAPRGIEIREAVPDDLDRIMPLNPLIAIQLVGPPAWAIQLPERFRTDRAEWEEELANPEGPLLLAMDGDTVLGLAGFYEAKAGPMVPDGAWELGVAMTRAEARGRGIARALVAAGFARLRERGATQCITDWRTASLAAARSWTAIGWVPTHHRLHRHIDERIAWSRRAVAG
jgi:GNAT superfamily N-acetyltransferase